MDTVITCDCSHIIGEHDAFGCQVRTCRCELDRDRVVEVAIENLHPKEWADAPPERPRASGE